MVLGIRGCRGTDGGSNVIRRHVKEGLVPGRGIVVMMGGDGGSNVLVVTSRSLVVTRDLGVGTLEGTATTAGSLEGIVVDVREEFRSWGWLHGWKDWKNVS